FFRPAGFVLGVAGAQVPRNDAYYIAITILFALLALSVASFGMFVQETTWEGKKIRWARALAFICAHLLLCSVWAWGIAWLQTGSPSFNPDKPNPLSLWKVGGLDITIPSGSFYALLALAAMMDIGLAALAARSGWLTEGKKAYGNKPGK
ncbi:MAG TPA: hypothetical protein PLO51_01755, partial [Candidatus Micrarchaeota archaeon]|nr:hypothetical protein [Candidatus Micrarchaeota archaeon]